MCLFEKTFGFSKLKTIIIVIYVSKSYPFMAFTPLDLAVLSLITAISAFPAVFFSLFVIFSPKRVKRMLMDQIKGLPDILKSNSDARFAVKTAVETSMKDLNTGVSSAISANLSKELAEQVNAIVQPQMEIFAKSLKASISGQIGAAVQNITSQMAGKKDGPLGNAFDGLIHGILQKKFGGMMGGSQPDLSGVPEISMDDAQKMLGYR